jgi:hypothetical protein
MADIEYDYALVPTIGRFSQSRKFIRGLMGPFGSGKSSGCVMDIVQWAARQPDVDGVRRSRYAVVRNTYRQLSDTSIKTWLDWLPDGVFGTYAKSDHNYFLKMPLDDGSIVQSEILFRALDRPEHVSNLLSLELTGAWGNEARELPWAVIKALHGRVGRYPSVILHDPNLGQKNSLRARLIWILIVVAFYAAFGLIFVWTSSSRG